MTGIRHARLMRTLRSSMTRRAVLTLPVLIFGLFSAVAHAITVTPDFDAAFTAGDRAIIDDAIAEWTCLFACGHSLTIRFAIDNTLVQSEQTLAKTGGWAFSPVTGRPTNPIVIIDYDDHNWTLGDPVAGAHDALDTLKHEVAHALGFTAESANFRFFITTVGGNRFFDYNSSGTFDDNDFDLIDDPNAGTHAPANSGDLMQPDTPRGQRNHPTRHHAEVLARAFGYTVAVPEPSTLGLTSIGFVGLVGYAVRRRRAADLRRRGRTRPGPSSRRTRGCGGG